MIRGLYEPREYEEVVLPRTKGGLLGVIVESANAIIPYPVFLIERGAGVESRLSDDDRERIFAEKVQMMEERSGKPVIESDAETMWFVPGYGAVLQNADGKISVIGFYTAAEDNYPGATLSELNMLARKIAQGKSDAEVDDLQKASRR